MVQPAVIAVIVVWIVFELSSAQILQMNNVALLLSLHYCTGALAARLANNRLSPKRATRGPAAGPDAEPEDVSDGEEATSTLRPVKRRRAATPLVSRSVLERSAGSDPAGRGDSQGVSSGKLRKGARGNPVPSAAVCARCRICLLTSW